MQPDRMQFDTLGINISGTLATLVGLCVFFFLTDALTPVEFRSHKQAHQTEQVVFLARLLKDKRTATVRELLEKEAEAEERRQL